MARVAGIPAMPQPRGEAGTDLDFSDTAEFVRTISVEKVWGPAAVRLAVRRTQFWFSDARSWAGEGHGAAALQC